MRRTIANVGFLHVTNIKPITAPIGTKKPIEANSLLVFVLVITPLLTILSLKILADKFNKDDIMYGKADIRPFLNFVNFCLMILVIVKTCLVYRFNIIL